ncbi:FAD dependent oxidoreductase [Ceraceosorus guamensis]|uniref:FAD dependent oxidoreductase n=1 Tax=Ceraceosorus guamensis TaxID=1522189 RepID=A0A316W8X6_9BASI|nr:FAD dependent oxidoreductase [Ceraceosorus guamensis]PWN44155.1 FAD dependent oxidoreductase [Ceraceosorus guamensis]
MTAPARHISIVGGGIIGVSSLYYLSRALSRLPAGSTLNLYEAGQDVAPAASGKSGGFLALDWHGTATADLAELSFRLHKELADEFSGREKWGYREVETLSVKFDSNRSRSKGPASLDWVDGKHVSSSSTMGGNGTTAQVTPRPLVRHLASEALKVSGVSIHKATRVVAAELDAASGRVKQIKVRNAHGSEEDVESTDLIIAAGPWTGALASSLFSNSEAGLPSLLRKAKKIGGSRAHSVVIQGSRPTTAHCLFTDMRYGNKAAAPEVYAREDGTVYICGGSDEVILPENESDIVPDLKATAKLIEQAAVLSPDVLNVDKGAKVKAEQACYLPISEGTGSPVITGDAKSGIYIAAGHSCWGITLGVGTGKVVQELVTDGKVSSADIRMLQ